METPSLLATGGGMTAVTFFITSSTSSLNALRDDEGLDAPASVLRMEESDGKETEAAAAAEMLLFFDLDGKSSYSLQRSG